MSLSRSVFIGLALSHSLAIQEALGSDKTISERMNDRFEATKGHIGAMATSSLKDTAVAAGGVAAAMLPIWAPDTYEAVLSAPLAEVGKGAAAAAVAGAAAISSIAGSNAAKQAAQAIKAGNQHMARAATAAAIPAAVTKLAAGATAMGATATGTVAAAPAVALGATVLAGYYLGRAVRDMYVATTPDGKYEIAKSEQAVPVIALKRDDVIQGIRDEIETNKKVEEALAKRKDIDSYRWTLSQRNYLNLNNIEVMENIFKKNDVVEEPTHSRDRVIRFLETPM